MDENDPLVSQEDNLDGIDLDNLGGDFDPVPEGWHDCVVDSVTSKETVKEDYTQMNVKLKMRVVGGESEGKFIFDNIPLPRANEPDGAKKKRLAVGIRIGLIDRDNVKAPVNWKQAEGLHVKIEVEHGEYNGKVTYGPTFAGYELMGNNESNSSTVTKGKYDDI